MSVAPDRVVHFVVPAGLDDPRRVSGGNVCDRRVRDGLAQLGWNVRVTEVDPDSQDRADAALAGVPDGAVVLIDGLVASCAPSAVEAAAERLRVVVLAHMVAAAFPDADPVMVDGERRSLRGARQVIATSEWTRSELVRRDLVEPGRVVAAPPGSDDAPIASGTATGGAMLCVGVLAPHKGQDLLIEALAALRDLDEWTCTIAGSGDARPEFADRLATRVAEQGLADRVTMPGVLSERELDHAYARTDLVVAPSRAESYGMAVADAMRRGIPIVASDVGGIPLTVAPGRAALLVPPDRPDALSEALRRWMVDPELRARLKSEARRGRARLPRWSDTAAQVATALSGVR